MTSPFVKIAAQGVKLIPCKASKAPAIDKWRSEASSNSDTIERWQKSSSFFGVPTGPDNGFWVLDLDKHKEGFTFPRESELPFTLSQTTKSGGVHYFFKWDDDRPIRNKAGVMTGVDVRGDGGYVVTCPSTGYMFTKKRVNFKNDILEAPDWLYDMLSGTVVKSSVEAIVPLDEVKEVLDFLDPTDEEFESRDGWQSMLRSVYSATGGSEEGKQLFLDWSNRHGGPWNKPVETEVERDWGSYKVGVDNGTTWGTAMHFAVKKGMIVPNKPVVSDTASLQQKDDAILHKNKKNGRLINTSNNLNQILKCEYVMGKANPLHNTFVFDEFAQEAVIFNELPWTRNRSGTSVRDTDSEELSYYLSEKYGLEYGDKRLMTAILTVSKRQSQHPVRNFLSGLEWDGKKRLENWLTKWCGVKDNMYTRAVAKKVLVAAVKRVFEPGCKFDNLMVLEGPQGCRKSTLLKVLGKNWYSAPHINLNSLAEGKADAITNCFGSWIIEMEEMASVCQADEKVMKKFLSTAEDTLTLKYDRLKSTFKRQFVMVGTINLKGDGRYLRDITGGRRIWPINVGKTKRRPIDIEKFEKEVNQLWAEAYMLYKEDYPLFLSSQEERLAEKEQKMRTVKYQGLDIVEDWVIENLKDTERVHCSTIATGIWGLNYKTTNINAVSECLMNLGWVHKRSLRLNGKVRSGFIKPSEGDDID